jgi:hypothetical protein
MTNAKVVSRLHLPVLMSLTNGMNATAIERVGDPNLIQLQQLRACRDFAFATK